MRGTGVGSVGRVGSLIGNDHSLSDPLHGVLLLCLLKKKKVNIQIFENYIDLKIDVHVFSMMMKGNTRSSGINRRDALAFRTRICALLVGEKTSRSSKTARSLLTSA